MLFTIIIPTHDRPFLLQRTLASLAAQTFKDFTTIVVSDSDKYVAPYQALQSLPGPYLYLLRNNTPGPATSRNLGIKLTDADYALFLDDDDTLEPTHLEAIAEAINNRTDKANSIFYCDFNIIEEDRSFTPPKFLKQRPISIPNLSRENIFVQNNIPNSCLIYPRSILQSAQFDTSLILFEDWDYLLGCLKKAVLVYLPISSVNIHKSYLAGERNIRRGNVNNELLIPTTHEIYRRHRSLNETSRQQRIKRFEDLGIQLSTEQF